MMKKHNFKVGDKVRLKNPKQFSCGAKICTVVDVDCGSAFVPVRYDGVKSIYFPLLPNEIKYVTEVGGQYMFSFMEVK